MSEEMVAKKKAEIEALDKAREQEMADQETIKRDKCPSCGTPTSQFAYLDGKVLQLFGWVECPICGVVFCPESIRMEKAKQMQAHVAPHGPGPIIIR